MRLTFITETGSLAVGQRLRGKRGSYQVLQQLTCSHDVWKACDENNRHLVVKRALPHLMNNEQKVLTILNQHQGIRRIIDDVKEPASLILEYMDDSLDDVCNGKGLESSDIKIVAHTILEALAVLHEHGFVHTDIKPANIFVNYGNGSNRFSKVALGDCGDVYKLTLSGGPLQGSHRCSTPIFRSPEVHLGLKWGASTDIWSLGTTLISLIFGQGRHIFLPHCSPRSKEAGTLIFAEYVRHFGPIEEKFLELTDKETRLTCEKANQSVEHSQKWRPFSTTEFSTTEVEGLEVPDRTFISKMMKFDPRDRPTARELLQDPWFKTENCKKI